jgi:hypothetical protein
MLRQAQLELVAVLHPVNAPVMGDFAAHQAVRRLRPALNGRKFVLDDTSGGNFACGAHRDIGDLHPHQLSAGRWSGRVAETTEKCRQKRCDRPRDAHDQDP